jgi:hypothetical protein
VVEEDALRLCTEVESGASNRVSLSIRIRDIRNAFKNLVDVHYENGDTEEMQKECLSNAEFDEYPPAGFSTAMKQRLALLEDSLKILEEEIQRNESSDSKRTSVERKFPTNLNPKGNFFVNGLFAARASPTDKITGIRRRIPRASSAAESLDSSQNSHTTPVTGIA